MNPDHIADQLRDQAQDELTPQGVLDMLRESIEIATADTDPFNHPLSVQAANFEQYRAIDQVVAAMKRYMNATDIDSAAVNRQADKVALYGDAA